MVTMDEVKAVNRRLEAAIASRDIDAVCALYAEDAVIQPPGAGPARGRAAIKEVWQGYFDMGLFQGSYESDSVLSGDDLGVEVGLGVIDLKGADGDTITARINYIVVHQRQADGSTQIVRDIWNDAPPA